MTANGLFKGIGQVLAALIYTPIYTGLMYIATIYPAMWIFSLPFWKMLIVIVILGGIIEGLVTLFQIFGLLPYTWIVKNNIVSFIISIVLCIFFPLYNMYSLWNYFLGKGGWAIFIAVVLSGLLLQFVVGSVICIIGAYKESNK